MGDEIFSKRIQSLLKESLLTYGTQLTPVANAEWPDSNKETADANVTTGETQPLNQPPVDPNNAGNVAGLNPEAMGEVSSLLISIGYILSKEGLVPDKFDVQAIVKFLTDNFSQINAPTSDAPPDSCGGITMSALQSYMESRKLFESKFKK